MKRTAVIVAFLAFGMLVFTPVQKLAHAHGFTISGASAHSAHNFSSARHYRAFGRWARHRSWWNGWWPAGGWPPNDGLFGVPAYWPDYGYAAPVGILIRTEPINVLTCKRSQETLTVPSEESGTRQITITRCH